MKNIKTLGLLLLMMVISTSIFSQNLSKSFSWGGLSLRYPSNYVISEKENLEDGTMFICSTPDLDEVISVIAVFHFKDEAVSFVSKTEWVELCSLGIEAIEGEFYSLDLDDLQTSAILVDESKSYPSVGQTFKATMEGKRVIGRFNMFVKGESAVVLVLIAENKNYLKELHAIANSIRLE